jgi:hypothetical protein
MRPLSSRFGTYPTHLDVNMTLTKHRQRLLELRRATLPGNDTEFSARFGRRGWLTCGVTGSCLESLLGFDHFRGHIYERRLVRPLLDLITNADVRRIGHDRHGTRYRVTSNERRLVNAAGIGFAASLGVGRSNFHHAIDSMLPNRTVKVNAWVHHRRFTRFTAGGTVVSLRRTANQFSVPGVMTAVGKNRSAARVRNAFDRAF